MGDPTEEKSLPLNRYVWMMAIVWSLLVLLSLAWNRIQSELTVQEHARIQARTAFWRDIHYRRWNSNQGGVYVPVSEVARPNPYLEVPNRDLNLPSGLHLTLINPAYMMRMVYTMGEGPDRIKGRITSLRPTRPENAPDAWEASALRKFEDGVREHSGLTDIGGASFMRLMRPLLTEPSCLKCHAAQGYREGDIRGGVSVTVPMAPLRASMATYHSAIAAGHFLLWLIGCGGIGVVALRLYRGLGRQRAAEAALRDSEERSRTLVEYAPFGLSIMDTDQRFVYLNPKFVKIFGYTLADIPDKSTWFEKAYPEPAYREAVRGVWAADTKHGAGTFDSIEPRTFRVRGKDGRERVIRFNNVPLADGRQILTYEDISIQVAAEEALRDSEQNLRLLSSGLLKAQEKERRRIAYALHDDLAQDLAVLTIEMKCIEEGLEGSQTDLRSACRKTHRHIVDIIENTRRLSHGLSPALLEELGLSAAVRRMIEDFSEQTGIAVSLDMAEIDHLFRNDTEIIAYRIFQEAFTNIRKHANATRVTVSIVRREGEVVVSIADNGSGFHPQEVLARRMGKGLGLIAMDERVRMLGRSLTWASDPGRGTRISFSIPEDRECTAKDGPAPACRRRGGG